MSGKAKDLTGQTFGRLTVLSREGVTKYRQPTWKCRCSCGNEVIAVGEQLKRGAKKSCGCLHKEKVAENGRKNLKHGMSGTRLYAEWARMKIRCGYPSHHQYKDYGGRGITVCEEWRDSFETFRDWALANGYQDDLTIDRIDNDGPYSPENCRWVTMKEQQNNRRNNRLITHNGKTQTLKQWAEETGIGESTIRWRLKHSYSIEKALTEPNKGGKQ